MRFKPNRSGLITSGLAAEPRRRTSEKWHARLGSCPKTAGFGTEVARNPCRPMSTMGTTSSKRQRRAESREVTAKN